MQIVMRGRLIAMRQGLTIPAPCDTYCPHIRYAQMAELVDALASGASGSNIVEVRVLFWAPIIPLPLGV